MEASRDWVEQIVVRGEPITYGINTGFGVFANVHVSPAQARDPDAQVDFELTRSAWEIHWQRRRCERQCLFANALAQGYSGVRVQIVETLIDMLNRGVSPIVPEKGSVGASGDLAPFSHLALVMSTDELDREEDSGQAIYQEERISGKRAMASAGISRLILEVKEGLALNNGTAFSAALTTLAAIDARNLIENAALAVAMTLEAIRGASHAFDARIHEAGRHKGQQEIAARVRALTRTSKLLDKAGRVQDAYSIRCAPQVTGAAHDALEYAMARLEKKLTWTGQSAHLCFGERRRSALGRKLSRRGGGHGGSLLAIAVSEVGAISERRTFRLLDGN